MFECAYDRLKRHKNKGSGTFPHHSFYWKKYKNARKLWQFVSITLTAESVSSRIWYRYKSDRQNWPNYSYIKNDSPCIETMDSALKIKPDFPRNCIWKSIGQDNWRERAIERGLTKGLWFNKK